MGWKPFSFSVRVTHSVEGVKLRWFPTSPKSRIRTRFIKGRNF